MSATMPSTTSLPPSARASRAGSATARWHLVPVLFIIMPLAGCLGAGQGDADASESLVISASWTIRSLFTQGDSVVQEGEPEVVVLRDESNATAGVEAPWDLPDAWIEVVTRRPWYAEVGFPIREVELRYYVSTAGVEAHFDRTLDVYRIHVSGASGIGHTLETPVLFALEVMMGLHELQPSQGPVVDDCMWSAARKHPHLAVCLRADGSVAHALSRDGDHTYVATTADEEHVTILPSPSTSTVLNMERESWVSVTTPTTTWLPPMGDAAGGIPRLESLARTALGAPLAAVHVAAAPTADQVLTAFLDAVPHSTGAPLVAASVENGASRLEWWAYEISSSPFVHAPSTGGGPREMPYAMPDRPPDMIAYDSILARYWKDALALQGMRMLLLAEGLAPLWIFGDSCLGETEGQYGIASALTGELLVYGTLNQMQTGTTRACAIMYPDSRSIPSTGGHTSSGDVPVGEWISADPARSGLLLPSESWPAVRR